MSQHPKIYVAGHRGMVGRRPTFTIWGSGTPKREFLYVDDMAAASVFVMNLPKATIDAHTQPMQSHITTLTPPNPTAAPASS